MANIDILMVVDVDGILNQYAAQASSAEKAVTVDGSYVLFITKKADAIAYNGNWQLDVSAGTETETDVDLIRWRSTTLMFDHKYACPITGFEFVTGPGQVETPRYRRYPTKFVDVDLSDPEQPSIKNVPGIDTCWESRAIVTGQIGYNIKFEIVDQESNLIMYAVIDPYFNIHN